MAHRTTSQDRHLAGLFGWFLLLVVAVALFTGLDDPRLATPAVTDLAAWGDWAAGNDPIMATVAILRLVLIGLTWYLLGASTIQVVARLTRSMAMLHIANAISVPLVRRVVSTTLGMGLAASMVSGATGSAATPSSSSPGTAHVVTATASDIEASAPDLTRGVGTPDSAPATMARIDAPAGPVTAGADEGGEADEGGDLVAAGAGGGPAMEVDLAGRDDAPTMRHARDPADRPVDAHASRAAATLPRLAVSGGPAAASREWTVRAGDHLWHVAETVMGQHLGRTASDAEITPYWQRLIETNRDCLPDPHNPDLIVPGLELVLPKPDPDAV